MPTTYPTTKQTIPNPTGTDLLDNANNLLDHDYQHSTENDTVEALQDKVGIDNDPNVDSFDYKLSNIASGDKAVSDNGTGQSITDITLINPQFNFTGDATGDMYYRDATGVTTRLPIGSTGQIIQVGAGGIPEYFSNPATSNASETIKGVVQEATQAEVDASTDTGSTGARLFATPSKIASSTVFASSGKLKFGGDGSDGALAVSSGTTTVDLGGLQYVVKQYSSISITGTGTVQFINPHANGTIILLKSSGNITLTSSSTPMLDASGCGGAGGAGGTVAGTQAGSNGNDGTNIQDTLSHVGIGSSSSAATTGGVIYSNTYAYTRNSYQLLAGRLIATGSGGGGAGAVTGNGSGGAVTGTADGGAGGNGGGALVIECAGSLNFTTALGISVAGKNGTNGVSVSSGSGANAYASAGGGGGSGGMCILMYNTLVSASGTINDAGGNGGVGGNATNTSGGLGGGTFSTFSAGSGAGGFGGAGGNGAAVPVSGNSNGTAGAAGAGTQAGGGGGSGASMTYNINASNTGGAGGAAGAGTGGLIAKNYIIA